MKADPPTDFVSWPNKVKPFGLKNGHGNTCLACLIDEFAEAHTREAIFIELWNMGECATKAWCCNQTSVTEND